MVVNGDLPVAVLAAPVTAHSGRFCTLFLLGHSWLVLGAFDYCRSRGGGTSIKSVVADTAN
jgi:hypothetical protein